MRPGTLMDTGDAMPDTEFQRPDPLDSDVIMDATARLLAPRRSLLSSILPKGGEKDRKQGKKGTKKAQQPKAEEKKAQQPKEEKKGKQVQKAAKVKQEPPKKTAPASQQKKKGSGKPPRRDRPQGMPPEPPRKNQPKDSTEQASLMKPYYLDIGR